MLVLVPVTTIRRKILMLEPDNTPTQPLPRIADTAPLSAIRASCAVPLPASLSPRGLAVDEPELPYQGDPPPLFGRAARAVLAVLGFAMVACGLMIAFQVGQLSVPTMPFADNPPQQGAVSTTPTAAPTKAVPATTAPPRNQPTAQPTRPAETNDKVIPVVDIPVVEPSATTPEATPSATPSTPSSEPSTPVTTAPATTQPPTSTAPVPTDQPTASAPAPEDLESTPPTE